MLAWLRRPMNSKRRLATRKAILHFPHVGNFTAHMCGYTRMRRCDSMLVTPRSSACLSETATKGTASDQSAKEKTNNQGKDVLIVTES